MRLAALPLALLLTLPAQAATVLSVGDGDTLRVDDRGKRLTIRLACIDAPEMAQGPYQLTLITQARMHRQPGMRLDRTYGRRDNEVGGGTNSKDRDQYSA